MSEFKVGDKVKVFEASDIGGSYEGNYFIAEIGSFGMIRLHDKGTTDGWVHPRQCELLERPKKTVKKTMWVWASEKKPLQRVFGDGRYFSVQVEAEVEVEE